MKGLLFSVCGILISLVAYSDAINVWRDFSVKEFRNLIACLHQDGSKTSVKTFESCQGPPVFHAVMKYCSSMIVPKARTYFEVIQMISHDYCLADKIYYCLNENIRCLTCYEESVEMDSLLACYRSLPKKFCPHGVNYKPMCKDNRVRPAPGSDTDCCVDKCVSKKKNHYYEKDYYKKDDYSNDYHKKDDYSNDYYHKDDYSNDYHKKDDYNMGYYKKDYYKKDMYYAPNQAAEPNEAEESAEPGENDAPPAAGENDAPPAAAPAAAPDAPVPEAADEIA